MYLSKAKASHSHKMWTEVSSSVPHLLHWGSFPIPIMHRCLLKVLRLVTRPITTLVWVLSRDNSRDPVAGSGPEINSRACLCVLQVPCHNARCCFAIQRCYPDGDLNKTCSYNKKCQWLVVSSVLFIYLLTNFKKNCLYPVSFPM